MIKKITLFTGRKHDGRFAWFIFFTIVLSILCFLFLILKNLKKTEELAGVFPSLREVLLDERDLYMTHRFVGSSFFTSLLFFSMN